MVDTEYTITRTIEDVEFDESHVEEIREKVRKELIEEGKSNPIDSVVEKRVKQKLLELAEKDTLYSQGENRLHNDIEHRIED